MDFKHRSSRAARLRHIAWACWATAAVPTLALSQPVWSHKEPVAPATLLTASVLLPLSDQRLLLAPEAGITAVLGDDLALRQAVRLRGVQSGTPPKATADGGLLQIVQHQLESGNFDVVCQVLRFDPELRVRWFENLPRDGSDQSECPLLDIDGGGQVWAGDDRLYALTDRDGIRRFEATATIPDLQRVKAIAADPGSSGGVHALATVTDSGDTVLALASDGTVRWRWTETTAGTSYDSIRRTTRGDLVLSGQMAEAGATRTAVTVLDANGEVRWRHVGPSGLATRLAVASDGRVLVATLPAAGSSEATQLFLLAAADGREEWRRVRTAPPTAVHLDQTGGVLVVETGVNATVLERLDASGSTRWRVGTSAQYQQLPSQDAFLLRADGSVLAVTNAGVIHRFAAADGSQSERTIADPRLGVGNASVARLGSDGHFAFGTIEQSQSTLTVLAPDGQVQWRQTDPRLKFDSVTLDAPDRVCAVRAGTGEARLSCWQLADGTLIWERAFDFGQNTVSGLGISALPDRRVVAVAGISGLIGPATAAGKSEDPVQRRLLVVDAQGQVVADRPLTAISHWQYLGRDGEFLQENGFGDQHPNIERFDSQGALRFVATRQSLNLGDVSVIDGQPLTQGESLLLVQRGSEGPLQLVLLDAAGAVRWQQALPSNLGFGRLQIVERGEALFVSTYAYNFFSPLAQTGVARLRRTDGALGWQIRAPHYDLLGIGPALTLDSSGQTLAFHATLRDSHEVQLYATADGQLLGQRTLVSTPGQFAVGARLDPSGQIRTLGYEDPADSEIRLRIDRHTEVFQPQPARSIGRVARSGAWFDAMHTGQGWLLDVLPASRTLYAAWFTYEAGEGAPQSSPARLRWYSLQGTYGEGAEQMQLDILENRGGVFAAPPVTSARKVGTATLRFDGCASGVLDYRFDDGENGGRADRVALRALAIRDPACPEQPSERQAAGFSSAASGAWFDPATAGQGVVGVVQPPVANQPGLLFAGWFHYDPAGRSDDPRGQAWLTLQGELPATASGSAEVGIFRTLGGSLGAEATRNTVRIGSATVRFDGCDRMTLNYQFDSEGAASPYAGTTGTQQLVKLGGCTRP